MFLPINKYEIEKLGWDYIDIILVTGDAYIDHPSFGIAIIGKYLLKNGYRVAVLAQPDIYNNDDFKVLPHPRLFIGISTGNVDSMVNNYTANKKYRSDDVYSENGSKKKRPDRALIAYTNKIKENYKNIPIVIGGIEASVRRFPHYDYWSNKVRNSILLDSKADILVYGQGEKPILEIANIVRENFESNNKIDIIEKLKYSEILGTAVLSKDAPKRKTPKSKNIIKVPSFIEVKDNKDKFNEMTKIIHDEINPHIKTKLYQEIGINRFLIVNPPTTPATEKEIDSFYDLDFERLPHPSYKGKIKAFEMIKDSITIHRGCFGGCSFCSIGLHQGKFIQSRSPKSIKNEMKQVKSKTITDLGGPSANMYKLSGKNLDACKKCKRESCIFPKICPILETDHKEIKNLYSDIKKSVKNKRFFVNSGIRHELALEDKEYLNIIAKEHTSGLLKVAPEHTVKKVLDLMKKPQIDEYDKFVKEFVSYSTEKKQFVLPYLISSFPGCDLKDMEQMMNYLQKKNIRIEQVQDFYPTPMALATAMYYTEKDPYTGEKLYVSKSEKERKIHRAMMQYFKPENMRIIRKWKNSLL